MEKWKPVKDYENLYMVSNIGRIKSLARKDLRGHLRKEKLLHPTANQYGYYHIGLVKNGKRKEFKLHRLVASAFLPNKMNYPVINHVDNNPSNNEVNNLEWCNYCYNNNYGDRIKKANKANLKSNPKPGIKKSVISVDSKGNKRYFDSIREAGRAIGYSSSSICACLHGKLKTLAGCEWQYAKVLDASDAF